MLHEALLTCQNIKDWHQFGLDLNISKNFLDEINKEFSMNTSESRYHILKNWLFSREGASLEELKKIVHEHECKLVR